MTDDVHLGYVDVNPPVLLWARQIGSMIKCRFSEEINYSSVTTENIFITGIGIDSVQLDPDQRTIYVFTDSDSIPEGTNLVVLQISDDNPTPNTLGVQALEIDLPSPVIFPLKINNGGSAYGDYLPDQEWGPDVEYGFTDGNFVSVSEPIDNTDDDIIYQTCLNRTAGYKVRVPNGTYTVSLKLSENYYSTSDARTYDLVLEDSLVIENLDVFSSVGMNYAYDVIINDIEVVDHQLDFYFSSGAYGIGYVTAGPFVNGLVVEQNSIFPLSAINDLNQIPEKLLIKSAYPNPFNSAINVHYAISISGDIRLEIISIDGTEVFQKLYAQQGAGEQIFRWKPEHYISSGVYFLSITSAFSSANTKLLYIK